MAGECPPYGAARKKEPGRKLRAGQWEEPTERRAKKCERFFAQTPRQPRNGNMKGDHVIALHVSGQATWSSINP